MGVCAFAKVKSSGLIPPRIRPSQLGKYDIMNLENPVFIPGPTNMPLAIRHAIDIPTVDHRGPGFGDILHPAIDGVRKVLKSQDAEVFLLPSTGTGGWETAIANTLCAGDKVLAARNGMFSHKWIDMCTRFGLDVDVVKVEWGNAIPVDAFRDILSKDKDHAIKAVLATHNETATGVTSDIGAIRAMMDELGHPAMLFVDGVSSIGSMDFQMDGWRVDVAVTGSQKGFMLPPGLGIAAFSAKAIVASKTATLPRTYFDINDMRTGYEGNGYPYTPPVALLRGLHVATEMLMNEGLENVFARHKLMADGVRAAVSAWGLQTCARSPQIASNSVTAILTPEGTNANDVVSIAHNKYNVAFGGGLGDVAGKVFRIGHLGMLSKAQSLLGISVAEMALKDAGVNITLGSGVAAAQEIYRA